MSLHLLQVQQNFIAIATEKRCAFIRREVHQTNTHTAWIQLCVEPWLQGARSNHTNEDIDCNVVAIKTLSVRIKQPKTNHYSVWNFDNPMGSESISKTKACECEETAKDIIYELRHTHTRLCSKKALHLVNIKKCVIVFSW